jgi:hypothetical protein
VRAFRATGLVIDAEILRFKLHARRLVVQGVLAFVAVAFLGCMLASVHVAVFYWLRLEHDWRIHTAAALIAAGDIVIAGVLAIVAMRLGPGAAEREARRVRQQAWRAVIETAMVPMLIARALRLFRRR